MVKYFAFREVDMKLASLPLNLGSKFVSNTRMACINDGIRSMEVTAISDQKKPF